MAHRHAFPALVLALTAPAPAQQAYSAFDAATVVLERSAPPLRRMLDFDLDGDPDAVGIKLETGIDYRAYAYRNAGSGVFELAGFLQAHTNERLGNELLIEVGLLDGDAWPDVCIVFGRERHDWLGQGDGHFTPRGVRLLPAEVRAMALVDLDGDGVDDMVWADDTSLRLSASSAGEQGVAVGGTKRGLRVLAHDGLGASDIFLLLVDDELHLFYGSPGTGLVAYATLAHGLAEPRLDTGDADGDGDLDALVFGPTSYRVARRTGPGSWSMEPEASGGPAEFLRDADGDGDLDGVSCGADGRSAIFYDNIEPTDFQVALNDGSGAFAPAFAIDGLGSQQLAGVLDVDGDGDVDLVGGRCVYFAHGPLTAPAGPSELPPTTSARSLSDYDGDGDLDLAFAVDSVYVNDGTGVFERETPRVCRPPLGTRYDGPGYPGDFDGDGDVDLVVELRATAEVHAQLVPPGTALPPRPTVMALLRNTGSGALLPPRRASDPGVSFELDDDEPENSLLVDADQDGDLDLLTRTLTHRFPRSVLWANDGTGCFRAGGEMESRALWGGDVDLDGDLDLIVGGAGYGGTSTYLMLGSAPVAQHLPTLTWDMRTGSWFHPPYTPIAEGDFDHDGYPDFAFAYTFNAPYSSSTQFDPTAFNNRFASGGTVALGHSLSHWGNLAEVSLGDVTGDGTVDALAGAFDGESAEVSRLFLNRWSTPVHWNSFQTLNHQVVPPGLLVDLDADGKLDVLGRNIARVVFAR